MTTVPTCSPSRISFQDPCSVWGFETAEFTENSDRSLSVFLWAVIIVAFLLIITYTCLVNPSRLALVNMFKNKLELLDVGDSGTTTHTDQGKKFVIEKQKSVEGGAAIVLIVMVMVVMVAYVVAIEIDLPAEVVSLRTHSLDLWITSRGFTLDATRFRLNQLAWHYADFGVFSTESLRADGLFFELDQGRTCQASVEVCAILEGSNKQYVSYSIDFWRRNNVVTLCSEQLVTEGSINFFTRTAVLPFTDRNINLPIKYFGESIMQWTTSKRNETEPPAVVITLTATTSVPHSIFSRFSPSDGIHKMRVDGVRSVPFSGSNCTNPVIQFHVEGMTWELMGIEKTGALAIILSVFGALGTILGTRTLLKEGIEWIIKAWRSSPRKRIALTVIAYIVQAIFGLVGLAGIVVSILFWSILTKFGAGSTALSALLAIAIIFFANAFFCWIGATVVLCKNCRRQQNKSRTEVKGEYILLSEK